MSDYRDPKPIDTQTTTKKIPERIKKLAQYVRTKMHGKDTREAMAQAAEEAGAIALESVELSESTEVRQSHIEKRYDVAVAAMTEDAEVEDGRIDAEGNIYTNIGQHIRTKQKETNQQLADMENELENNSADIISTIISDEDFEPTGRIIEPFTSMLSELAYKIPNDTFNICHITDIHRNEEAIYFANDVSHLQHATEITKLTKIDCLIAGGDNADGFSPKKISLKYNGDVSSILRTRADSDVFLLKGNHDDAAYYSKYRGNNIITEKISDSELSNAYGNPLYFYKDYPGHKVRIIGVNTSDLPLLEVDGKNKYPSIDYTGFQQQQLDWLANTALQLPNSDWQVIIFGHFPLVGTFGQATQANGDIVLSILKSFMDGSSVPLSSNLEDYHASVHTNFTLQGKGTIIAYVCGHIHATNYVKHAGINCISTDKNYIIHNFLDGETRTMGTKTQDSWDIFAINRNTKTINIYGFGNSPDRTFNY